MQINRPADRYPFRTAMVTGASSGIGEAMVRLLANAGVRTVVVARRLDRLADLAASLDAVEVLAADLTTDAGLALTCERLSDDLRPIDLVVNNAGFGTSGQFYTLDPARLAQEIRLNVSALTQLSHAAVVPMVARKSGWLLNVSSVASFQPVPGLAVYAATKAFVTSFSEALHEELRSSGVKVTALCPGLTRTEFQSVSNMSDAASAYPSVAWLSAEKVARDGLAAAAHGKALSVPGIAYKGLVSGSRLAPRALVRRIAGLARHH